MDAKTMGARLVYPMTAEDERDTGIGGWGERGLTLRQHFAGLAMQGFCAKDNLNIAGVNVSDAFARKAVRVADALLAELAKDQQ